MRNFVMEEKIRSMFDSYRMKLPKNQRSWDKIAQKAGLARKVIYQIIDSSEDIKRESIISLAIVLGLSKEDFNLLFEYKGFTLRPFLPGELAVAEYFEVGSLDHYHFEELSYEEKKDLKDNTSKWLKEFKADRPAETKGWISVTMDVDLSRSVSDHIMAPDINVRRDSVFLICFGLKMTLEEAKVLMAYKGYVFRPYLERDRMIMERLANKDYDHIRLSEDLIEHGELPLFNYSRSLKF